MKVNRILTLASCHLFLQIVATSMEEYLDKITKNYISNRDYIDDQRIVGQKTYAGQTHPFCSGYRYKLQ